MECKCKRIRQVKGNNFTLAILLQEQQRVIGVNGDYTTTSNYVPDEGDVVTLVLKSECGNTVELETTVANNCVTAEVGGDVPVGCYGVEIVVTKADGKQRRFYESTLIEIVNETRDAGIDDGVEFGVDSYLLQALMIAGLKGEKGEVEFDKLTPEQLALLKGEKGDKGDRGEPGAIGPTGTGISGIAYYADDASGNRIYTISLTDSSSYNITVPKGTGISSITYSGQDAEGGNVYIMQLTDNTSATFTAPKGATGNDGADGVNGQDGADGEDGVGIEDIEFKEEDADGGNVYTITLSNSDTYDITAPKGTGVASVAYKSTDASGGYVYTITLTNGDTFDFTAPKGDAGIYVGDDDGTAPVVSFDPQADTVHVTQQTLSSAQKQQARQNIGAAGVNDVVGIPIVNHGTSDTGTSSTPYSIAPNTLHVWGEVTALYLSLTTGEVGYVQEYMIQFTSGSTATTLELPSTIKWINGFTPADIGAECTCQVSIMHGVGVIGIVDESSSSSSE